MRRYVEPRDGEQLASEWDQVAVDRDRLIAAGQDPSYRYILLPALRSLASRWLIGPGRVLDAGCGTGRFTAELARTHPTCRVVGIDPSARSIELARSRPAVGNLEYHLATVEAFGTTVQPHTFDLVVANMLLQNVASLTAVLQACWRLLAPGGALVWAIPHPCFWPRYWRYEDAAWFRYDREVWIEAPFRTSLSPGNGATTTHTHRPLEQYIGAFSAAGLMLEELAEPYPDEELAREYPTVWEFPRFLLGRCAPRPAVSHWLTF